MKALIAIAALLVGTSAYACPDLAGKYSCPSQNGNMEPLNIEQRVEGGVTIYTMQTIYSTDEAIADGVTRTLTGKLENGNDAELHFTVTCATDSLIQDGLLVEKDSAGNKITQTNYHTVLAKSAKDGGLTASGTVEPEGKVSEPFSQACVVRP